MKLQSSRFLAMVACAAFWSSNSFLHAQSFNPKLQSPSGSPNLRIPTWGGVQFWGDEFVQSGWRIQRNVLTTHYRLLDPENIRHAYGDFATCQKHFDQVRLERKLPPVKRRLVFVLHGLGRSRGSMRTLSEHLAKHSGWDVVEVGYPSTREPVSKHAEALGRIIQRLSGVKRIDFVAHSMGNIVIRRYLADREKDPKITTPKIGRIVMIAPPNHGSVRASLWAENMLFQYVFGAPGNELGVGWKKLEKTLTIPKCEFGVLAGAKGDGKGWRDYLPGDDDGTVCLESTRLQGAVDFATVPTRHTFIMDDPQVLESAMRFLEKGYFITKEKSNPIEELR